MKLDQTHRAAWSRDSAGKGRRAETGASAHQTASTLIYLKLVLSELRDLSTACNFPRHLSITGGLEYEQPVR